MGTKGSANRQRIVEAADQLFYSRGYNRTSFSDISDETGIPRGNFYYYFKTKEDILAAVVESRLSIFQQTLDQCNSTDPLERLLQFAEIPVRNEAQVLQYGCPIGTLSSELCKDQDHEIADNRLTAVFDLVRDWCIEQFTAIGFASRAEQLSMDFLARLQGVAVIANVYNDREFLHRGTADIQAWLKQVTAN